MIQSKGNKYLQLLTQIRALELIVKDRFKNEMALKQTVAKDKRIEHLKNATGTFLIKKDQILSEFKSKNNQLTIIENLFSGNKRDHEESLKKLLELGIQEGKMKELLAKVEEFRKPEVKPEEEV